MKQEQGGNQEFYQVIYGRHNNYRVKGVLGHGAISEVLIGSIINEEDPFNEQDVAIKVLKNTTFIGNQENKYFFQEKDIVHKLSTQRDDHIVNIIEVIETNDQYYIIMEYCENGSLLDQIYLEIPNRLKVVVNFSTQLTKGIHFLHAHGIAHRDLKPENIFIHEKDGQYILKIGDYGLGKNEEIYMMHSCIGTINYMAPEMIRKQEYDFTVDVWALGCIMHELITGEQLFADFTIAEISNQIRSMEEYRCIEGNFGYLISRCLQPQSINRIKVSDLYSELYHLYDDIANQRVEIVHRIIYKNYREQQSQQQLSQQPAQQANGNQSNTQMVVSQIFANSQEYFNTNEIQEFGTENSNEPQLSLCINKDFLQLGTPLTPNNNNNTNFQNTPSQYNNNYLNPNHGTFFKENYLNKQNGESNENISQNNIQKTEEGNNTNTGTQAYSIENEPQNQQTPQNQTPMLQSQSSLDPRYLDLNRTQNYFYQDKDTQQALRKKAQYNKKKGKTHKIKKQKEIFNNLNLKHADSVTFLAQESPSTNKSNKFPLENRFELSQPPPQLQIFPYTNSVSPQIPSPSQMQQNQQQHQPNQQQFQQPFLSQPPQQQFQQQNQNYNQQQMQSVSNLQQKQFLQPPGQQYIPPQQFQHQQPFQIEQQQQYQPPQQQFQMHQPQFQQPTSPLPQQFQIPQQQFQQPQNQYQVPQTQFTQKQQIQQQQQQQLQQNNLQQQQFQQPQNISFTQNQNQYQQPQQHQPQYQQPSQNPILQQQQQQQQLIQGQKQSPFEQTSNKNTIFNFQAQNQQMQNSPNQPSFLNQINQQQQQPIQQQEKFKQLQIQSQPTYQPLQQQQQYNQQNQQQYPVANQQNQYQAQQQQQSNPIFPRQNVIKQPQQQQIQPPIQQEVGYGQQIQPQYENQQYQKGNSSFSYNQINNNNNSLLNNTNNSQQNNHNNNPQHYNSSSNYSNKFNLNNANGTYQSNSSPNHQLNKAQNEEFNQRIQQPQLVGRGIYVQQQQQQQPMKEQENIQSYYQDNALQNRNLNGEQNQYQSQKPPASNLSNIQNDKNNETFDYFNKNDIPHYQFQRLSIQNSTNRDSINSNFFSNSANENQDYFPSIENDFYKNESYYQQQDQLRKNQDTQSYYYQIPTGVNQQYTYTPQQEEQIYNRP